MDKSNYYYYSYDSNTGTFTSVPTGTAYAPNTYYTLNDIATNPGHYEFVIPEYNNGAGYICNLKLDGAEKITATLPNDLFKNKADIKIIIRAIDGGANVVEDEWTIQAGQTIIPYDSKPLSMFFLLSEIGQDLYQNYNIIGIGTSYNSFVEGGTYDSHSSQDLGDTDYELHTVLYKGSDGNNVFDVEETYYVLVGHSTVMSFAFNAGADYFINLTIDESNIIGNEASIKDFRKNFVTIWSYSGGKFVDATPTGISVSGLSSPFSYNEAGNDTLTVSNINKITTNQWKPVIIYDGSISRTIQLYFNIVINARETDDDGNDIFDEASGVMVKNDSLASAMAEQGDNTLTNDEISNNLKKELLSLIKFNDSPVVVDGVVDSVTLSRYSIEVIKDGSYYKITYTYTGTSATYTRTLTMSAS